MKVQFYIFYKNQPASAFKNKLWFILQTYTSLSTWIYFSKT